MTESSLINSDKVVTIFSKLLANKCISSCVVSIPVNELNCAFTLAYSRIPIVLQGDHLI